MREQTLPRAFVQANQFLARLPRSQVLGLAVCGVFLVGGTDSSVGREMSVALFYLLPVGLVAWHIGSRWGLALAGISCISWYLTEVATGSSYSSFLIPLWNGLVRFGFFSVVSFLIATVRTSFENQRHLARTDSLTGLFDRRAFHERLEHDLAMCQRLNCAVTLAYLDLDDFKMVNDTYGHAEGDKVLRITARVLQSSIRHADTAARLGGDEFALILPNTDSRGAEQVINTLTEHFRQAFPAGAANVACSIGVVTFADATVTPDEAIAATDRQMYQVKRAGKAGVGYKVQGEAQQPAPGELHSLE